MLKSVEMFFVAIDNNDFFCIFNVWFFCGGAYVRIQKFAHCPYQNNPTSTNPVWCKDLRSYVNRVL